MLGVGGFSFSLGIGVSLDRIGFTENAGSRYDSRNLLLTFAPLSKKKTVSVCVNSVK